MHHVWIKKFDMNKEIDDSGNLENWYLPSYVDTKLANKIVGKNANDPEQIRQNNGSIVNQCIVSKYRFVKRDSNVLYNLKTCEKRMRSNKYSDEIIDSIDVHWNQETEPSPNTHVYRKLKDENAHHYVSGHFKDEYTKWIDNNQELLKEGVPSNQLFQKRRQKYDHLLWISTRNQIIMSLP
eukprot:562022_1